MVLGKSPLPKCSSPRDDRVHGTAFQVAPFVAWARRVCWLICMMAICGAPACVHRPDETSLPNDMPIKTAIVVESISSPVLTRGPEELIQATHDMLQSRRFIPSLAADSDTLIAFGQRRETAQRLAVLHALDPNDANATALVIEVRAQMYSLLNGLFRWVVTGRVSLQKRNGPQWSRAFEIPVFLRFDHERENEAVRAATPRILRYVNEVIGVSVSGMTHPTVPAQKDTAPAQQDVVPTLPTGQPSGPDTDESPGPAELIYFVMVDRFANGDTSNDMNTDTTDPAGFHGGDLAGLEARLDTIQKLGVTTIWLSPIYEMRREKFHGHGAFHGYWVKDFSTIEAGFGRMDELISLRNAAQEKGMTLMLDIVTNHMAFDAPLVAAQPGYFHRNGDITNWDDAHEMVFHDVHGLPDLAQENSAVYNMLTTESLEWVKAAQPTMIRLDAAGHVSPEFLQRFQTDLKKGAQTSQLRIAGEIFDGDAIRLSSATQKAGLTYYFDFPLYYALTDVFCKHASMGRLGAVLSLDQYFSAEQIPITFLDNHDVPRVTSACGGNDNGVRNALSALMMFRGIPALNYGTEWLLEGAAEPENRGDMRFDGTPPLLKNIASLMSLRTQRMSLQNGQTQMVSLGEKYLVFLRQHHDETTLVVINQGDQEQAVSLEGVLGGNAVIQALYTTGDKVGAGETERPSPPAVSKIITPAKSVSVWDVQTDSGINDALSRKNVVQALVIEGVDTKDGDRIVLAGVGGNLGGWEADKGLHARQQPDGTWAATLEGLSGDVLSYKLIQISEDGTVVWEKRENRYVLLVAREGKRAPTVIQFGDASQE
jgi:glycosidase